MTVVAADRVIAKASTVMAERHVEYEPRPSEQSWWQTRQSREALVERLLGLFTDPSAGRTRDKTRRRGLTKLLDWLQRQPGDTWQDRWLASGADSAGFDWADLPLRGRSRRDAITATSCAAAWRCWSPGRSSGPATRGCCGNARH